MNRPLPLAVACAVLSALFSALPAAADEAPEPGAPALRCTTGPHSGTYDGEAETTTQLVCDELRRVGARGTHTVTVSKLGSATFLSVSDASGESRRLQIASIEEVPVAAPRIAEALANRTTTVSTQRVDNVVAEEQREYKKQKGEMLGGLGLAGAHVFGADSLAIPAFNLRGAYETLDFAAVADLRFGGTTDQAQDVTMLSIGAGGRYFILKTDATPFVGGGMSFTSLSYSGAWDGSGNGIGLYAEAGVEALRTHKGRLAFDTRIEIPFYGVKLTGPGGGTMDPNVGWRPEKRATRTLYGVPLTFAVSYSYRGI